MKVYLNYLVGSAVLLLGCVLNYWGDRWLGVHFELYYGIGDFSPMWVVDVFVLPLLVGYVVAVIYGFGGKWIAFFVPLISHFYSYLEYSRLADLGQLPEGAVLQPMAWWGFFVIVAMEVALIGGVFGEAMVKKTYGRRPRHLVFKDKRASLKKSS